MEITDEVIRQDIEGFKVRITETRAKLDALPARTNSQVEYKKVAKQRRDLEADINHLHNLLRYAWAGLDD